MNFYINFIYIIFIVFIVILFFSVIIRHFGSISTLENQETNDNVDKTIYTPKCFLTPYEYNFLSKFIELENELHINIVPQVNLAAVINKQSSTTKFQNELYRNIDFGIFNADYSKLLLLIELNDSSHDDYKRKKRDMKVRSICNKADIKLITFYTKYPNDKSYVKNRIVKELNIKNN